MCVVDACSGAVRGRPGPAGGRLVSCGTRTCMSCREFLAFRSCYSLSPRALLEPSGKRHGLSLCHWTEVSVAIVFFVGCQVCGADSVAELMGGGKEQRRGSAYERYARC